MGVHKSTIRFSTSAILFIDCKRVIFYVILICAIFVHSYRNIMGLGTQIICALLAAAIALYYSGKSQYLLQSIDKAIFGSHGCLPAEPIEELTLTYFNVRARGESIRMILQDNNVPYSEVNFDSAQWPEYKKKGIESGMLTFGQVPAIKTSSGVSLVQSIAIVHYIGRSLGLDCDCDEYHMCEVIALGTEDLRSRLGKVMYDTNFSIAKRNVYLKDVLPIWLSHFEKLAPKISPENNNDSYFVGNRLTWIDYIMFDLIDCNMDFVKHSQPSNANSDEDILKPFPRLANFYQNFYRRPQLKSYLVSESRIPYKLPYPPSDTDETS